MEGLGVGQGGPCIVHLQSTTLAKHLNIWCSTCLLPGGYDVTYAVELEHQPLEVLRLVGCVSCGPKES